MPRLLDVYYLLEFYQHLQGTVAGFNAMGLNEEETAKYEEHLNGLDQVIKSAMQRDPKLRSHIVANIKPEELAQLGW